METGDCNGGRTIKSEILSSLTTLKHQFKGEGGVLGVCVTTIPFSAVMTQ